MVVALGIVVGEVELLHRLTEAHGQHAVHLGKHFLLVIQCQADQAAAVLLHQGAHHIPVAAVGHGRREQPVDLAVVQRLVGRGHHVLEEPGGALQLVEERQVGLGQLEGALRQIKFLLNVEAQHV